MLECLPLKVKGGRATFDETCEPVGIENKTGLVDKCVRVKDSLVDKKWWVTVRTWL